MHSINIDSYAKESDSMNRSSRMVDELQAVGANTLSSLVSQRGTLKGAHRRLLDVANVLGLSNSVMRVIERRDWADKWLVYGGILLTILLLWFCMGLVK
jgi:Golgi SNAP receptor complex protein 2